MGNQLTPQIEKEATEFFKFIAGMEEKVHRYRTEVKKLRKENNELRKKLNDAHEALGALQEAVYQMEYAGFKRSQDECQ